MNCDIIDVCNGNWSEYLVQWSFEGILSQDKTIDFMSREIVNPFTTEVHIWACNLDENTNILTSSFVEIVSYHVDS